jgi:hypothetical protein
VTATPAAERAVHLQEVAAVLWPPPSSVRAGRRESGAGESYLLLPGAADPRLVLPAGRRAAAAAVRRYGVSRSRTAAVRSRLLAAALRSGAGPLLLRDRLLVSGAGSLVDHLRAALGRDLVISFHLTPPRANRKPVLQLLTPGGAPVGFAKLGVNPLTRRLVDAEHAALRSLAGAELRTVQVPEVLHHGRYGPTAVLVQSALPVWEGGRVVEPRVRLAAMREVAEHAGVSRESVATAGWTAALRERVAAVPDPAARAQLAAVLDAAAAAGTVLAFGSWHGDWTPWNMAVRDGRALVWDWERFAHGTPVGFDAVHYALQEALWSKDADPRATTVRVLAGAAQLLAPFEVDPDAARLVARLYLVELATRYLLDGQAAAGARLGQLDRWLLPALAEDGGGAAAPPEGRTE